MSLKVLMVYPRPSPSSPQRNPPLSILYPGEAAAREGFEISYWDSRFDTVDNLQKRMSWADVLAISTLSGYQLGQTLKLITRFKTEYHDKPTILGGVHPTLLPEQTLAHPDVDFVVAGEGEKAFPELLRAISGERDFNVPGVGFDGVFNERTGVLRLKEEYVSPVSDRTRRYFEIAAKDNSVILPSARGCPRSKDACAFCPVDIQYRHTYRVVPFESWRGDIDAIHKFQPFTFLSLEDENSVHLLKNREYIEYLKSKGIEFRLHLRADSIQDDETVQWLKNMGCRQVYIGVESGDERVRNQILRKGETREDFLRVARLLAGNGIQAIYSYMVGIPGETKEEIMRTLKLSDELANIHPRGTCRSSIYVFLPLPGTGLFDGKERTLEEWAKISLDYNPDSPPWVNNLYYIGGFHHNRYYKTPENFPGLWRLAILPSEVLMEIRWRLRLFDHFLMERRVVESILNWRTGMMNKRV